MGRRKKAELGAPLRIRELIATGNCDPFEGKMNLLRTKIKVPKDTEPALLGKLMKQYQNGYELVMPCYEDGDTNDNWYFVLKVDLRFRILESMCRYVYPQLKATENKTEMDMTIKIVTKQFTVAAPQVIGDVPKVVALPDVVDAIIEESNGGS